QPVDLFALQEILDDAQSKLQDLNKHLKKAGESGDDQNAGRWAELRYWQGLLNQRVRAARRSLLDRAPWLTRINQAEFKTWKVDARFEDLTFALSNVPAAAGTFASYDKIDSAVGRLLECEEELETGLSQRLRDLQEEVGGARDRAQSLAYAFAAQ